MQKSKSERLLQSETDKLKSETVKLKMEVDKLKSTAMIVAKAPKNKNKKNKPAKHSKTGYGYEGFENIGTVAANFNAVPNGTSSMGGANGSATSIVFPLNPSNVNYPLNSTRSLTYDKWRHRGSVRVKYTPLPTSFGAVSGDLIIGWIPDSADPIGFSVPFLTDLDCHIIKKVSEPCELVIPFAKLPKNWFYTRFGDVGADEDVRLYDTGLLVVTNFGCAAPTGVSLTTLGNLEISFDVEYKDQVANLVTLSTVSNMKNLAIIYCTTAATGLLSNTIYSLYNGQGAGVWVADRYLGVNSIATTLFDYNSLTDNTSCLFQLGPGTYIVHYAISIASVSANGQFTANLMFRAPLGSTGGQQEVVTHTVHTDSNTFFTLQGTLVCNIPYNVTNSVLVNGATSQGTAPCYMDMVFSATGWTLNATVIASDVPSSPLNYPLTRIVVIKQS